MSSTGSQHSFLGLSKCPVSVPVHTLGLGMVAYSLFLSYKVFTHVPAKSTKVQMPIFFDMLGRPAYYVHPCVGSLLYPTAILLASGAECGFGMFREATQNAGKKGLSQCPLNGSERLLVQTIFATSLVGLFAQEIATRVVLDRKTPDEVEVDNLHASDNKPYQLACWKVAGPIALAFVPAVAAIICKAIHKK